MDGLLKSSSVDVKKRSTELIQPQEKYNRSIKFNVQLEAISFTYRSLSGDMLNQFRNIARQYAYFFKLFHVSFSFFTVYVHLELLLVAFKPIDYRPQQYLRKGNVFTSVCQEFCPQARRPLQPTVRILLECILVDN